MASGQRSGAGAMMTRSEVKDYVFSSEAGTGYWTRKYSPPPPFIPFNPTDRLTKKEKYYALCTKEPLCYLDPSVKGTNCYK